MDTDADVDGGLAQDVRLVPELETTPGPWEHHTEPDEPVTELWSEGRGEYIGQIEKRGDAALIVGLRNAQDAQKDEG